MTGLIFSHSALYASWSLAAGVLDPGRCLPVAALEAVSQCAMGCELDVLCVYSGLSHIHPARLGVLTHGV